MRSNFLSFRRKQNVIFAFCMSLISYPVNFIPISEPLYLQDNLGKEECLPLEDQHTPCLHCMGHLNMNETLCPVDGGPVGYQDATFLYQTNKNIVLLSCTVQLYIAKPIEYCSVQQKDKLLDTKYCTVHSPCIYNPNNKSEFDTRCAHHTITEQYTFSVPIFSSFSVFFFLHLVFLLFILYFAYFFPLVGFNYSSTVNLTEHTE
jgi:hypothetical protein